MLYSKQVLGLFDITALHYKQFTIKQAFDMVHLLMFTVLIGFWAGVSGFLWHSKENTCLATPETAQFYWSLPFMVVGAVIEMAYSQLCIVREEPIDKCSVCQKKAKNFEPVVMDGEEQWKHERCAK